MGKGIQASLGKKEIETAFPTFCCCIMKAYSQNDLPPAMPLLCKAGWQGLFKTSLKRHLQGQNSHLFGGSEVYKFGKNLASIWCSLQFSNDELDVINPEGTIYMSSVILVCRSLPDSKQVLLHSNYWN